jgi:hypothetical protein
MNGRLTIVVYNYPKVGKQSKGIAVMIPQRYPSIYSSARIIKISNEPIILLPLALYTANASIDEGIPCAK